MALTNPRTDHDQLIKGLLKTFLKEYLCLFFPALAERLHLDSAAFPPEFIDKEFFTDIPKGQRRTVDILVRVWTREETFETILIHSEQQEDDRQDPDGGELSFEERMFSYSLLLQLRKFPERVVPCVLWFVPGKGQVSLATYDYRTFGAGLSLTYYRVCVPDLSAEEYVRKDNPLAWGLAARMRRGSMSKVELSLACRSRIARASLNDVKKVLLLDMCKTYIKLDKKEEEQMQAILDSEAEYQDVKQSELTYYGRVAAELTSAATAKTKIEDLLEVLEARDIPVGEEALQRIRSSQDVAQLGVWFKRALRASSLSEVLK